MSFRLWKSLSRDYPDAAAGVCEIMAPNTRARIGKPIRSIFISILSKKNIIETVERDIRNCIQKPAMGNYKIVSLYLWST